MSRASGERILPPMSGACATLAAQATRRSARKIGWATETSGRWPVASQGLLVMKISPGRSVSGGNSRRKCFTVLGRQPMNDGMLACDWDSELPSASVRTTEKSYDSRTTVENDVLTSVAAASSTTAIRRLQRTWRVTGSKRVSACLISSDFRALVGVAVRELEGH